MNIRRKQIILPIGVFILTIVTIVAIMAGKTPPQKGEPETAIPVVDTLQVTLTLLTLDVESQGLVEPPFATHLVAQVSGEILSVNDDFMRGNIVRKGAVLAEVDPFNYEVRVQQANASLASARAAFILERAQGQVAEAEWAKITSAEPSELGLRKPQQEQALANVKAAEAALRQAEKDLQRTRIVAPYDAIIQDRAVSPGSYVSAGSTIGQIADMTIAEVRLPVNQNDFAYLDNGGIGAEVTLTAELAGKHQAWPAYIVRSEGIVDKQSRMTYLVARVPDPYGVRGETDPALAFGTFVSAQIQGKAMPNAVTLPRAALLQNRVPLVKDSKLVFAEVNVVRHEGKQSIVEGGLQDGDKVIVTALDHPVDGMDVNLRDKSSAMNALEVAQ